MQLIILTSTFDSKFVSLRVFCIVIASLMLNTRTLDTRIQTLMSLLNDGAKFNAKMFVDKRLNRI